MTTRDEIFSGTKEVDEKLVFNSDNLNDYLKKIIGSEFDIVNIKQFKGGQSNPCLLYTSPSPRDSCASRMPSSA